MRKSILVLVLLSCVIAAKAQQNNKPSEVITGQSPTVNQETLPEPPGGLDAFMKYMKKYTNHQYNNDEAGKVTLSFIVEKDGSLTNYKIVHSLNTEADNIALQVLKDYNQKWKPAVQNSQPVNVLYTISVQFGKE